MEFKSTSANFPESRYQPVALTWLSWGVINLGYTIKNEQVNEVIQILKVLFAVLIAINLKAQ